MRLDRPEGMLAGLPAPPHCVAAGAPIAQRWSGKVA